MRERKRILTFSILVLAASAFGTAAIAITVLYRAAFEEEKADLVELARSHAHLLEAVVRHDEQHDQTKHPLGPVLADMTGVIVDVHEHHQGFGDTGELVVARREGEQIVFLFPYRHGDGGDPDPVPWASGLAKPRRPFAQRSV